MQIAQSSAHREDRLQEAVRDLAARASVEVTPRQVKAETSLASMLDPGTRVYVPFLPKADYLETVVACRELVSQGFQAVPHLPARSVADDGQLRDWLTALRAIGVDSVLLIAGDRKTTAGPYADTLGILETGLLADYGFYRLGIAGHPEGHPVAEQVELDRSLDAKLEYARVTGTDMWMVSQFAFGSAKICSWLERLHGRGCRLPVHVGIPGPTSLGTLIGYAAQCGVDASTRVLARHPGAARLLGRWTPDGLVWDLAHYQLMHPGSLLKRIHVFSFGGVGQTAQWLRELRPQSPGLEGIRTSGAA